MRHTLFRLQNIADRRPLMRAAAFALMFVPLSLCGCARAKPIPIATLPVTPERNISIVLRDDHSPFEIDDTGIRSFAYCVYERGTALMPGFFRFGGTKFDKVPGAFHFALVTSRDHDIVGVLEKSCPGEILVLYQFSTGFNFPYNGMVQKDGLTFREREEETDRLIRRLKADNPSAGLEETAGVGTYISGE